MDVLHFPSGRVEYRIFSAALSPGDKTQQLTVTGDWEELTVIEVLFFPELKRIKHVFLALLEK